VGFFGMDEELVEGGSPIWRVIFDLRQQTGECQAISGEQVLDQYHHGWNVFRLVYQAASSPSTAIRTSRTISWVEVPGP